MLVMVIDVASIEQQLNEMTQTIVILNKPLKIHKLIPLWVGWRRNMLVTWVKKPSHLSDFIP